MAQKHSTLDLSASQQPRILASNIVVYCFVVIVVVLRFASRKLAGAGFWWDDWLILPPTILVTVVVFSSITWLLNSGFGKHIEVAGLHGATVFAQELYISEICYTVTISCVKYSILAFYWRLFSVSNIRLPIYILTALTTGWGVACLFVNIFQCVPVNGFWDKTIAAICGVNDTKFFYGQSIPNIITDVAILSLPIRYIWHIQAPRSQKILLTGTFITGGLVVAISITRFTYLVRLNLTSPDVTWNFVNVQIWTTAEMNIAIVSACLPSLRPIIAPFITGPANKFRKHLTSSSRALWKLRSLSNRTNTETRSSTHGIKRHFSVNSGDRGLIGHTLDHNDSANFEANCSSRPTEFAIGLQDLERAEGIVIQRDVDIYRQ